MSIESICVFIDLETCRSSLDRVAVLLHRKERVEVVLASDKDAS